QASLRDCEPLDRYTKTSLNSAIPLVERHPGSHDSEAGVRHRDGNVTIALPAAEVVDVVRQAYEHQDQEERDSDRRHTLVDLAPDCPAAQAFDYREQDEAAVER